MDEKYHAYNDRELELAHELIRSLPMELQNLLDDYRSSVLSRESQGLIFAYLSGMKDGVNYTKIVEQFTDKL